MRKKGGEGEEEGRQWREGEEVEWKERSAGGDKEEEKIRVRGKGRESRGKMRKKERDR